MFDLKKTFEGVKTKDETYDFVAIFSSAIVWILFRLKRNTLVIFHKTLVEQKLSSSPPSSPPSLPPSTQLIYRAFRLALYVLF